VKLAKISELVFVAEVSIDASLRPVFVLSFILSDAIDLKGSEMNRCDQVISPTEKVKRLFRGVQGRRASPRSAPPPRRRRRAPISTSRKAKPFDFRRRKGAPFIPVDKLSTSPGSASQLLGNSLRRCSTTSPQRC